MTVRSSGNPRASFRDRFLGTGNRASIPYVAPLASGISASGGTTNSYTDSGINYTSHVFTSSGAFVVSNVTGTGIIDYLIVGGGGGGGGGHSGGGGAGGYRTSMPEGPGGPSPTAESTITVPTGPYPVPFSITIGAGAAGANGPSPGRGGSGNPSHITAPGIVGFTSVTSEGGGGGGNLSPGLANNGGSGGGAGVDPSSNPLSGGLGNRLSGGQSNQPAPNQGYPGGSVGAYGEPYYGGGGGGAGAAGGVGAPTNWGIGGVGKRSAIAGPSYPIGTPGPGPTTGGWLAGGGGGGGNQDFGTAYASPPNGGAGGGGGGVKSGPGGTPGTTNTGGGGGGGPWNGPTIGGNGGSGIIVIRYRTSA